MTTTVEANGHATSEADHLAGLTAHHLRELRASGLSDETIRAAGIRTETAYLVLAGLLDWRKIPKRLAPAMVFPFVNALGQNGYSRIKPDNPRTIGSIETLQEWFGYQLTGDTSQQKILLLIGPPRSGKGTVARIQTDLLGRENVSGPTLASLEGNFGLSPLLGKSAAIISDARLSGKTDQAKIVERLLAISGEDSLDADRKFREPVTGKIPARITIISNELPKFAEASGALANRMIVLRLTNNWLGRENTALTDQLRQELPGILLWAIEGWRRLRERGRFVQPPSGDELFSEMRDLTSPVGMFLRERCEVGAAYEVVVDEVYAAWCEWCKRNGRDHPGTKQTLGRDLRAAVPTLTTGQHRDGNERLRYFTGLRLKAAGY